MGLARSRLSIKSLSFLLEKPPLHLGQGGWPGPWTRAVCLRGPCSWPPRVPASHLDSLHPDGSGRMVAGGCGPSSLTGCVFSGCHSSLGLVRSRGELGHLCNHFLMNTPKARVRAERKQRASQHTCRGLVTGSRPGTGLGTLQVQGRELCAPRCPSPEEETHRSIRTVRSYCPQSKGTSQAGCSCLGR